MPLRLPDIPFDFHYGNRRSADVLSTSRLSRTEIPRPSGSHIAQTTWTDDTTGLEICLEQESYPGFPAVEWVVSLTNTAAVDTPILQDLVALDACILPTQTDGSLGILHYVTGGANSSAGYKPLEHDFSKAEEELVLAPQGGRSSDRYLPFFNLQTSATSGAMLAVGWSGQWQARFQRTPEGLRLQVGQQTTHLRLHPGETIRTPRMLVLDWEGDLIDGHNLLRRFLWDHHTPLLGHQKPAPMTWANSWFTFDDGYGVTERNQKATMTGAAALGLEFLVIDAGWYECPTQWWLQGVGNWEPRPEAFPNSMAPVAKHGRKEGIQLGLWFEFERATRLSRVAREHPEWILDRDPQSPEEEAVQNEELASRLVNLARPDVQDWFIETVDRYVGEGITWFRHDFNIDPLGYWRKADAPDRQGMTENLYIQGLYHVYDEIRRRHPGLIIEGCAGGGHRIDLETITRNHGYWAADLFDGVPETMQACIAGANLFLLPHLHNTVLVSTNAPREDTPENRYRFFSVLGGAPCVGYDTRDESIDFELGRRWFDLFKEIRHLTQGEFYPLTECTIERDGWMAHQFHRPDLDEGLLVAFRRPECTIERQTFPLRGLDANASYRLNGRLYNTSETHTGSELLAGVDVTLKHQPDVEIIHYTKASRS